MPLRKVSPSGLLLSHWVHGIGYRQWCGTAIWPVYGRYRRYCDCGDRRLPVFSVSGPTAAFVVILLPVSQQFGLGGPTDSRSDVGDYPAGNGSARFGKLIEYIPDFRGARFHLRDCDHHRHHAGEDFFGLPWRVYRKTMLIKVIALVRAMPTINLSDTPDWRDHTAGADLLAETETSSAGDAFPL